MPTSAQNLTNPTDTSLLDALIDDDPHLSWIFWSWKCLGDVRARQQVMQGLNTLMAGADEIIVQTWEHPFKLKAASDEPDMPSDIPKDMEEIWKLVILEERYTTILWVRLGFQLAMCSALGGKGIVIFKKPCKA